MIKNFIKKLKDIFKKSKLFKVSLISLLFIPLCSFTYNNDSNSKNISYNTLNLLELKDINYSYDFVSKPSNNTILDLKYILNKNTDYTLIFNCSSDYNKNFFSLLFSSNYEINVFDTTPNGLNIFQLPKEYLATKNDNIFLSSLFIRIPSHYSDSNPDAIFKVSNLMLVKGLYTADNVPPFQPNIKDIINSNFENGYNQGVATGQLLVKNSYSAYCEFEDNLIPYSYSYDIVINPENVFLTGYFSYNHNNILENIKVPTNKLIINGGKLSIHKGDYLETIINDTYFNVNLLNSDREFICNLFKFNLPFMDKKMSNCVQLLTPTFYNKNEIDISYNNGYQVGKTEGYNNGYNEGLKDSGSYSVFNIFTRLGTFANSILSINLAPGLTIGGIILMPLIFGIFMFFIKFIKK